ncbi:MAG: MinD/ParA family protein [Clostridiales bacterium]|jgi:flagellar biosynthesis protein FlhG|nr:MinD/ParA family protein [Eubacteriales bacterium]MDH7565019.1 MinD/ParA family protein [Clostridiales bacterium]
MKDQAERLRQIIDGLKLHQAASQINMLNSESAQNKSARVIAVTSGKGGVGKTNVTINLAIALSELGKRVIILDADFGLANVDVLFGITPKFTLVDVIYNRKSLFEVLADGPRNIKFISGGSGVEDLVKLESTHRERFIENIGLLDKLADIILIDTGAGLSENVMSFVMAADEILLVTTPEPTSITDAYVLIKMVSKRDKDKVIKVVINRAENANEANDILNKLCVVAEKFLALKLNPLGYILQDEAVPRAVKLQQPFSLSFPKSQASKHIMDISRKLVDSKGNRLQSEDTGIRNFVKRFFNSITM